TKATLDVGNPGNFSLSISDPYQSMVITEYDIEKAISDAVGFNVNNTVSLGKEISEQLINDLQVRLNKIRADRGASEITFKINPDTFLGQRVVAIVDRAAIEIKFNYNPGIAGIGSDVKV